jgi:phosphoenolpyruvate-protein phosphotransferase (PTS system enzyme I)
MIMDDSMFSKATIQTIQSEKINAEWALKKSVQNIEKLFTQIEDHYIKERIVDVQYVAERVLRNLVGKEQDNLFEIKERVIIVAHELSPADTSSINISKVMGFITDVGGRTSHAAIMAQSLKIPAVVGLETVTHHVHDGTLLIVDGQTGEVIIDPDDDEIILYQEKQLQREMFESSIIRLSHLPAETVDGQGRGESQHRTPGGGGGCKGQWRRGNRPLQDRVPLPEVSEFAGGRRSLRRLQRGGRDHCAPIR